MTLFVNKSGPIFGYPTKIFADVLVVCSGKQPGESKG